MELDWQALGIILATIGGLLWTVFHIYQKKAVDRDFKCIVTGGRYGEIQIELNGRIAKVEYEIGSGEAGSGVDFIIYASSVAWVDGETLSTVERSVVIDQIKAWGFSRGSSIEFAKDT